MFKTAGFKTASASVLAVSLLLAACSPSGESANAAAAEGTKKEEPAFVEGLPRNQWLTLANAIPSNAEGVVRDEKRRPYSYALLGQKLPAFSAQLASGETVTEDILRGKWTIVDVWGIWCGDCRRDGPLVKSLYALAEADPDVEFLSLHTPPNAKRADEAYGAYGSVQAYFDKEGGSYPTIIDKDASLREAFQIVWTPTYLLVGPDLTVQAFRTDLSVGDEAGLSVVIEQAKAIRNVAS